MELRALIIQACNEITEDMCCRVIDITVHVEEVVYLKECHILRLDGYIRCEHVLTLINILCTHPFTYKRSSCA
jgi:hypothetical protein